MGFLFSALLFSCAITAACGQCLTLEGQWYDPTAGRNNQLIFGFDSNKVYAITSNPQWATGTLTFNTNSSSVSVLLDNGDELKGSVDSRCSVITWTQPKATWLKSPDLNAVHVIFMNHLDVGYNGISPAIGFINNILNKYFHEYFPRALQLATAMKDQGGFVYTTHPWLLYMFFNCPANFVLNNITLLCPSQQEILNLMIGIQQGYIDWHAGPMNMQIEVMNANVLNLAQSTSDWLDNKFKGSPRATTVWSLRDVPGMTVAVTELWKNSKVKAVTVGVNSGSSPPAVPKLFSWKMNSKPSSPSIIAMWHAGGYPGPAGMTLAKAGGISIFDSIISERDKQALVFAFRSDNRGPPTSIVEITTTYSVLKQQFPTARSIFASTLSQFVGSIEEANLPVVVGEIGDTWIQGIASDPLKMALYRALGRSFTCKCTAAEGCCPNLANISPFLVKLPEHTWGLPSSEDSVNWTNEAFSKIRKTPNIKNCEASWLEQRRFFNYTVENADDDFKQKLESQLRGLNPVPPSLHNFTEYDRTTIFQLPYNLMLGFGHDGSVTYLARKIENELFQFAKPVVCPLGAFSYHTYNDSDYDSMNSVYTYYGNAGFNKPGASDYAKPNSTEYKFEVRSLYRRTINTSTGVEEDIFVMRLEADPWSHSYYGSPETVWIEVIPRVVDKTNSIILDYQVIWFNKTTTRLPEATMFSFRPCVQDSANNYWSGQLHKLTQNVNDRSIAIDVMSVIQNGSLYQHAVESVSLYEQNAKLANVSVHLYSLDVPLVCPIFDDFMNDYTGPPTPTPFVSRLNPRLQKKESLQGFAFNIHNNVWNTNYPLWYPFSDSDKNFKTRYRLTITVDSSSMRKHDPLPPSFFTSEPPEGVAINK